MVHGGSLTGLQEDFQFDVMLTLFVASFITDSVELSKIKKFIAAVEGMDWCRGDVFFMPILRDESF